MKMKFRLPMSSLALALLMGCATERPAPQPTGPSGVVEWGGMSVLEKVDLGPEPRVFPDTPYPSTLLEEGVSGSAVISFVVDTDGHCTDVTVKEATRSELGAITVETVKKARFMPAKRSGQAVKCRMEWSFIFRAK